MNRRQKIIVSVTGIFLVLLILVGLTYAFFVTRIRGNNNPTSISVTTANLELVYADGNGILQTGKLEPSNNYITFLDGEGNEHSSKIFTVTNNGNATVEGYKVYLENVQNQLERKDDLVYTLTCKSYINYDESTKAISGTCNGVGTETTFPSVITSIVSNDIAVGITHEYELKAKYKEMGVDQSVDMNKIISARINIADAKTKFLARAIIDNAQSTPATNKTLYIEPTLQDGEAYTIPAHSTSLENERVLTYTFDDYGTSYYFRGNVVDNYVNYAGMCWRIVRIEGDGSVKILLEDYDQECNSKDASGNLNMDGNWSDGNTYEFGDDDNYNFINYTATNGLQNSFKTFQTTLSTKISGKYTSETITDKLKIDEWCYDDNITEYKHYDSGYNLVPNPVDGGYTDEYYGAYTRIYTNKKPSFSCSGTKLTKFRDGTDMYVATLTADEMSFAGGGSYNDYNFSYYLMNTYASNTASSWWSLSPYRLYEDGSGRSEREGVFILNGGGFLDYSVLARDLVSRPAVTLKSGSVISGGEGTQEEPYVIN